jgi:hypothetical protein
MAGRRYWRWGGFIFIRDTLRYADDAYRYDLYAFTVPYWAVALAASLLPGALAARRVSRRSNRSAGACPACGYDLRATPGRCPECGRVASVSSGG